VAQHRFAISRCGARQRERAVSIPSSCHRFGRCGAARRPWRSWLDQFGIHVDSDSRKRLRLLSNYTCGKPIERKSLLESGPAVLGLLGSVVGDSRPRHGGKRGQWQRRTKRRMGADRLEPAQVIGATDPAPVWQ
jgi:hypothetical protein